MLTDSGLKKYISEISPLDEKAMEAARARQESLAKPPHSLGRLEDMAVKFSGITGEVYNSLDKRRVIVFSADNGVVAEDVASAPQSVTLAQTQLGAGLCAAHGDGHATGAGVAVAV